MCRSGKGPLLLANGGCENWISKRQTFSEIFVL